MKSLTEFYTHKLVEGINAQKALAQEGKQPEEIEQILGESFKLEGDKLKFFVNSMTVAAENTEKLSRIRVMSYEESESLPPNVVKIEDHYYLPVYIKPPVSADTKKFVKKGGGQQNKGHRSGPKPSPWGISPEEVAIKLEAKKKAAQNKGS